MKKIIYENKDRSVSVLTPMEEALSFATIEQIAEKDVPAPYQYPLEWGTDSDGSDIVTKWGTYSTPYWIVEDSVIPTDRTSRSAWGIDHDTIGNPHGFGGESNEFDAELLSKYLQGAIA